MKILYFYDDENRKTKQETWKIAVTSGGTAPDETSFLNTKLEMAAVQNYIYDANNNHVRSEGSQNNDKRLVVIDKHDDRGNPLEKTAYRVSSFSETNDKEIVGKVYVEYTYH